MCSFRHGKNQFLFSSSLERSARLRGCKLVLTGHTAFLYIYFQIKHFVSYNWILFGVYFSSFTLCALNGERKNDLSGKNPIYCHRSVIDVFLIFQTLERSSRNSEKELYRASEGEGQTFFTSNVMGMNTF